MNSPEWVLSQKVLAALVDLNAVSIEAKNHKGVPDISYAGGWIELKYMNDLSEVEKLDKSFTEQQRHWLKTRWELGEECWLLIQVESICEWFLLSGEKAQRLSKSFNGYCEKLPLWDLCDLRGSTYSLDGLSSYLKNHNSQSRMGNLEDCCKELKKFARLTRGRVNRAEEESDRDWKVVRNAAIILEDVWPELIHAIVEFPNQSYYEHELPENHKPHLY